MKKRTECYVCGPYDLELSCPENEDHKITWSEYENHIWCYVCKKDIKYKSSVAGPIPVEISKIIGIDYRKYSISTGKIIDGTGF